MARLAFAPAVGDLQRRALTVPLLFLSLSPFVRWSSTARALPLSIRDVHSNKQQKHQQRRRRRGISGGESEAPSRHPALVPCFWKGSRSDRADRNYVHRFRFASAFCGSERAAVLTRLVFPYSDDGTSVAAPMPSAWILTGCLSAAARPSLAKQLDARSACVACSQSAAPRASSPWGPSSCRRLSCARRRSDLRPQALLLELLDSLDEVRAPM